MQSVSPPETRLLNCSPRMGIACGIHYPVPIHLQDAYQSLGYEIGTFPIAERAAHQFISLPMYPELTVTQIDIVTGAVKEAVETCVLA